MFDRVAFETCQIKSLFKPYRYLKVLKYSYTSTNLRIRAIYPIQLPIFQRSVAMRVKTWTGSHCTIYTSVPCTIIIIKLFRATIVRAFVFFFTFPAIVFNHRQTRFGPREHKNPAETWVKSSIHPGAELIITIIVYARARVSSCRQTCQNGLQRLRIHYKIKFYIEALRRRWVSGRGRSRTNYYFIIVARTAQSIISTRLSWAKFFNVVHLYLNEKGLLINNSK